LVTPDELPEGGDGLVITSRRNGETVQRDTTANMFWKVPEIIEMAFRYQTMEPGDVICTGSCGGTVVDTHRGVPMDDPNLPYLRHGEVIESEVEGVGLLRNPIVEER
jgi:2-keto-4-pentenoate hydratase/2-oxohepta-3-ene-1,7-dioic acid hydratase in catechol pathway